MLELKCPLVHERCNESHESWFLHANFLEHPVQRRCVYQQIIPVGFLNSMPVTRTSTFRPTAMNIVWIFLLCLPIASLADKKKSKSSKASTRLYGSQDAKDGQFPYTTFHIQRTGSRYHTCTGSLVGERWVMTAGHCVTPGDSKNHLVAAGKANMADYVRARYRNMPFTQDIDEKKYDLQERRAVAVYQHPDFNRMGQHDVGLVKVNKPFVINNRVQTIPISKEPFESRSDCTLTGYGLVENNVRRYHLQYINGMPARPARLCRFQRFRDVICLGDQTRGVCHGDSGGPLACGGYVRGVASHGLSRDRNCGRGTIEQYYTDTERNGQWINSVRNETRRERKRKN